MMRLCVAAVIVAASVAAVGAAGSWGAELQPYTARSGFSLPYGPSESALGRSSGVGEVLSPSSISIDSSGDIVISDPVKRRIARFDRLGSYLASVPVDGVPLDTVTDGSRNAVLTSDGQLRVLEASGGVEVSQRLADELVRDGIKSLGVGRGSVWATTGRGESFRVVSEEKEPKGVPEKSQSGTCQRGELLGDSAFGCFYEQGGRVVRYAADGRGDLTVSLGQEDLAGVTVAGTDRSGAFYVICEIGTEDGCRTECRKYSRNGVMLARFDVASDEGWTARSTAVSPDGTVYRLVSDDTCIRVTSYSQGGAS